MADAHDPASAHDPANFPPFAVTVDLVVLTVRDGTLHVLLVERGCQPFAGRRALPGGFVRPEEDLPDAARRELREETGVEALPAHLEQLATYGTPGRDPRMRVVSVAYLVLAPDLPVPRAGTDAAFAEWAPAGPLLAGADEATGQGRLAFDHARILADGVDRARAKLEYTPLATTFCPQRFTIAELRRVYEAVWGCRLDPRNFHRKITGTPEFVVEAGSTTTRGGGRPAQLYRAGPAGWLIPPLLRQRPGSGQ
ncbi:MAG: NUDIX hydrolase [Dactylosporangium sp.]|nr:NUDIX hydrolase [Dactylosporangium sp.]NNJ60332.1 NUDIX hydrolase [Dactylosporangium sp.]